MSHNDHIPRRISIVWSLGIGVVLLLAVGWAAVSADESEEEASETRVVRLEPGDNFVGWIDESMPIGDLFETIPQIEAIYFWDAANRHWRIAAPKMPRSLWTLSSIDPGMSVLVRVGGEEAVEWLQPITPVRGLVELHEGTNWVSWAGVDGSTVMDVAKGMGRLVTEIRSARQVYEAARPESAESWAPIPRGEALAVTVTHDLNWLQPTFLKPVVSHEGASSQALSLLESYLNETLQFANAYLGMHADASVLRVTLTKHHERAFYLRVSDEIVLTESDFQPERSCRARRTVVHEYIHALQNHLSNGAMDWPAWLIEGSAESASFAWQRQLEDSCRPSEYTFSVSSDLDKLKELPPLDSIRLVPDNYPSGTAYQLSRIAADRLVAQSRADTALDFYRAMPAGLMDAHASSTDKSWERAFRLAFGMSTEGWVSRFQSWRAENGGSGEGWQQNYAGTIRGRVTDPFGEPIDDMWVWPVDILRTTYPGVRTDEQGRFALAVPQEARYKLYLTRHGRDECGVWHSRHGPTLSVERALEVRVGSGDPSPLDIAIAEGPLCAFVNGRLVDAQGQGIADAVVSLRGGDELHSWSLTAADGSFSVPVAGGTSYRVSANIDGCIVYYRPEGAIASEGNAAWVTVEEGGVSRLRFQLRAGACGVKIVGRMLDSDGNPIFRAEMFAPSVEDGAAGSVRTGSDGAFAIEVPGPGQYRLWSWVDGCTVYYTSKGATASHWQAEYIRVGDFDVTGIVFRLAEGMCELRIAGRLLNADGTARSRVSVKANWDGAGGEGDTDTDGSFSFAVTKPGPYRLIVHLGGCRIYLSNRGPTRDHRSATIVRVSNADVTGLEFRLPEDPAAFCN